MEKIQQTAENSITEDRRRSRAIIERCRAAKNGTLVARLGAIYEAVGFIAEIEMRAIAKETKALAVIMRDRAERGRL